MKIKKPSLKGMKHTKYLGHFAQDKYMEKGHNLSGRFPMFREPSQLEMMGPSNPFDVSGELKRREEQAYQETLSQTREALKYINVLQDSMRDPSVALNPQEEQMAKDWAKSDVELQKSGGDSFYEATRGRNRTNRKKFLTEI